MADDDFDIDIYGDTTEQDEAFEKIKKDAEGDVKIDEVGTSSNGAPPQSNGANQKEGTDDDYVDIKLDNVKSDPMEGQQQIKSTDESGRDLLNIPKQAPQQQGTKRKEGSDDRPIDPGATAALLISDLHWWNTDDDVRGWVNQAHCEDELKDITFSEHKVNGKSKGQAYVEFTSQQAATAAKHKIDAFGEGQQYVKKHTVTYSNPQVNPFRTLPKDAPMRAGKDGPNNRSGSGYIDRNSGGNNFNNSSFRGRTPGYNANRGNMNNMGGGFNRNFSSPAMGNRGGFQSPMGGFQGNAMSGSFGGFNPGMINGMRGGNGTMRGGRGGMGNGMGNGMNNGMMGMPMGGMPMAGMGGMAGMSGPIGMGNMGGGMPAKQSQHAGTGFQGMQPHFNPAFFQQQSQAGGNDWQNPHGAKRPRPE
ncbi:MAG: hypothetical protein M1818_004868 [Claussenomyces sp. TS43310]|nr:MAG: hypothetical protein M1818_004868 [Claussenomyces sp. TS43310]